MENGWLREGETRGPGAVRAAMLRTVDEATGVMRAILDGKFKVEMRDRNGATLGFRTADIKEIAMVYKCLAGYALPTTRGDDPAPRPPTDADERTLDDLLDQCTDEELSLLQAVLQRADAVADPE